MKAICMNKKCSMLDYNKAPLYVDNDHFTDYASERYIYPDFLKFLKVNKLIAN